MDYDNLIALISGLVPLIGSLIALVSWQNSQFSRLSSKIENVEHRQALKDSQIEGVLERHELIINGNRESIQHRTDRLLSSLNKLSEKVDDTNKETSDKLSQFQGYLERHGFQSRGSTRQ